MPTRRCHGCGRFNASRQGVVEALDVAVAVTTAFGAGFGTEIRPPAQPNPITTTTMRKMTQENVPQGAATHAIQLLPGTIAALAGAAFLVVLVHAEILVTVE